MVREDVEERFVGAEAVDRDDTPVGEIRQVFVDDETDRPRWASVRVTLLGAEVLVPLEDAAWDEQALHLAVGGPAILGAPRCVDTDAPTERDHERLCTHYGIPTRRTPREESVLAAVGTEGVCYSVHDEACDQLQAAADAVREADEALPATVSGHMVPTAR